MKYGASSSLLILDYIPKYGKFRVTRRIEVPKAEYSYDKAVNMIIELNRIYDPKWIYVDRGSGEYQLETLHKYGDQHPESGLKVKVKGFSFSQKIDVIDPVTRIPDSKPMKPFMVNQLTLCIERNQLILSPFDEILHKQLIDYEVIRQSQSGLPVFTDKNEHFVDALGLAFLAFAMEMPDITKTIEEVDFTTQIIGGESPIKAAAEQRINSLSNGFASDRNPWSNLKNGTVSYEDAQRNTDGADKPSVFKVSSSYFKRSRYGTGWGSRCGGYGGRSMF